MSRSGVDELRAELVACYAQSAETERRLLASLVRFASPPTSVAETHQEFAESDLRLDPP